MAPHLMRAQGAYKADKHARPTHAHTHTHTQTHTHTHIHTHTHTHTHKHTYTRAHTHTHTHTHTRTHTHTHTCGGFFSRLLGFWKIVRPFLPRLRFCCCCLFCFVKRRLARTHSFHSLCQDQSTVAQRAEAIVAERSLTSCV